MDVRIVRYVIGDEQRSFIVEWTPGAIAAAIRRIVFTPGLRASLSAENLASIKAHPWQARETQWIEFSNSVTDRIGESCKARRVKLLLEIRRQPRIGSKRWFRSKLRRYPYAYTLSARAYHHATSSLNIAGDAHVRIRDWIRNRLWRQS